MAVPDGDAGAAGRRREVVHGAAVPGAQELPAQGELAAHHLRIPAHGVPPHRRVQRLVAARRPRRPPARPVGPVRHRPPRPHGIVRYSRCCRCCLFFMGGEANPTYPNPT